MRTLRKSKTTGATPVMRVKPDVASSVLDPSTGNYQVLRSGSAYPADHPIVTAYGWAFEPDEDTDPDGVFGPAVAVSHPDLPAPDDDAAERLAATRAEIGELSKPLPPARRGTNVDELASTLAARAARRQALELTIPSLEREVIDGRLHAAEALIAVEQEALSQAGVRFSEAEAAFKRAQRDFEDARSAYSAAQHRMMTVQMNATRASAALIEHDQKFFPADAQAPEALPKVEGWPGQ